MFSLGCLATENVERPSQRQGNPDCIEHTWLLLRKLGFIHSDLCRLISAIMLAPFCVALRNQVWTLFFFLGSLFSTTWSVKVRYFIVLVFCPLGFFHLEFFSDSQAVWFVSSHGMWKELLLSTKTWPQAGYSRGSSSPVGCAWLHENAQGTCLKTFDYMYMFRRYV